MVAVVLVIAATVRLPFGSMREWFELTVQWGTIFLVSAYLMRINKWAGLFLLFALFSHSYPIFYISGWKVIATDASQDALYAVLLGCLLYGVIVERCTRYDRILNALVILACINVLFLATYKLGGDPYKFIGLTSRADIHCGIMANPNESGALMALCFPAFLRKRWCYGIPVVLIGLVLSSSFGGVLGVGLATCVFLSIMGYWWVSIIAVIGGIVYWKFVDAPQIDVRLGIWKQGLSMCFDNNPVLGCGLGNWKAIYPKMVQAGVIESGFIRLHNGFIQGYVEMGIGFVMLLIGYIADTLRKIDFKRTAVPLAALGAITGTMIANSVFQMNALNGMIIVVWLAILEVNNGDKLDKSLQSGVV